MTTTFTKQDFDAAQLNAISQFHSVARTTLNAIESFSALNLNAVRDGFENAAANSKALVAAKNPQEVAALSAQTVKPSAEKVAEYSKHAYAITSETAQEIGDLFRVQFEDAQQTVKLATESAIKSFPFGSDFALAAVKQAEEVATKVINNINASVAKAKTIAEENFASVTKATKAPRKTK